MRTLVIDTSTEACSAALYEGEPLVLLDHRHEVIGRGHAERLIPMISELPGKGKADLIRVSLGPGSFTGLRIGIAAARALGIAWDAQVLGYPTLAMVAACARAGTVRPVTVCMNGGHGEWFVQNFNEQLQPEEAPRSLVPEMAAQYAQHKLVAGNRANELAALMGPEATARDLLPNAHQFHLLDPSHLTGALAPVYGREPDAKLPAPKP